MASVALSVERERRIENVFHMLLRACGINGMKSCKQLFSLRLAFTIEKKAAPTAVMMSVLCVAVFWAVNARSCEKILKVVQSTNVEAMLCGDQLVSLLSPSQLVFQSRVDVIVALKNRRTETSFVFNRKTNCLGESRQTNLLPSEPQRGYDTST